MLGPDLLIYSGSKVRTTSDRSGAESDDIHEEPAPHSSLMIRPSVLFSHALYIGLSPIGNGARSLSVKNGCRLPTHLLLGVLEGSYGERI